jgi:predicted ABC-type ATPase
VYSILWYTFVKEFRKGDDGVMQPSCTIIAGPNGAGKTTFAMNYLSDVADCRRFINADLIAAGLSPLSPEAGQLEASRIFLTEIKHAIESRSVYGMAGMIFQSNQFDDAIRAA